MILYGCQAERKNKWWHCIDILYADLSVKQWIPQNNANRDTKVQKKWERLKQKVTLWEIKRILILKARQLSLRGATLQYQYQLSCPVNK